MGHGRGGKERRGTWTWRRGWSNHFSSRTLDTDMNNYHFSRTWTTTSPGHGQPLLQDTDINNYHFSRTWTWTTTSPGHGHGQPLLQDIDMDKHFFRTSTWTWKTPWDMDMEAAMSMSQGVFQDREVGVAPPTYPSPAETAAGRPIPLSRLGARTPEIVHQVCPGTRGDAWRSATRAARRGSTGGECSLLRSGETRFLFSFL